MLGPDWQTTPAFLELRFQWREKASCIAVVRTVMGVSRGYGSTKETLLILPKMSGEHLRGERFEQKDGMISLLER